MGLAWRALASPTLKLIDSERAHSLSLSILSSFGERSSGQYLMNRLYRTPELPIEVFEKLFQHPLGLAAGFDKGAEALLSWSALGFSWSEYGGITRYPQDGNPKPRMFRANKDKALVNSMGLNNPGVSAVRDRLISRRATNRWPKSPVAANIGRSMKVANEYAGDDYAATLDTLWDHADLFVLNTSSPNTPGLRDLQGKELLEGVLESCGEIRRRKAEPKPILLKLSPDASDDEILESTSSAIGLGIDGFVATNTTIKRPVPLTTQSRKAFAHDGGLSGRPLHDRAIEVIDLVYQESQGKVPIVGVGGIESKDTAWNAIYSGASLLQMYSALVFKGPSVVSEIVKGLKSKTKELGFSNISEVVGHKHI
ncbi:uncharacterized protein METZ01_LOCUS57772 [marine metagenome]|uniref:dihydroorotate dehydrogenase (quinone) n=1 Tax=marine metagenome TaxID=408172 RepID=A0A381SNP0_9ZZZZ